MYINVNILGDLEFRELVLLQIIKQLRTDKNVLVTLKENITEKDKEKFLERELVTHIKGTKKDCEDSKLRLTKKGQDLLDNISTPEVTEGDIKMFEYLSEMYLSSDDDERVIGNKKKVKTYISVFRNRVGLTLHEMYYLCWAFLKDYKYTKKLENIFFDSNKNRYGKFENNLEDSPLYQYLEENDKKIKRIWKAKIQI